MSQGNLSNAIPNCDACLPVVVLFKDPPSSNDATDLDSYTSAFSSAPTAYAVRYVPVLTTTDQPAALESVLTLDPPAAYVITSARAARVFARIVACGPVGQQPRTVWAVGQATARPLASVEGLIIHGTDTGNAEDLTGVILSQYPQGPPEQPLVVLRGDKSLDVIPTRLRAAGFHVHEVQVYATAGRLDLPLDAMQAAEVKWWVLFSPSGVDVVRGTLAATVAGNVEPPAGIRIAAIGQTTAKYLASEHIGWTVDAVAAKPTAEGLVEAILGYDGAAS